MTKSNLPLAPIHWQVGWTTDPSLAPKRFVPAKVPGAVQLDWALAEGWPAYWHGLNFQSYAWMEDVHWIYRATLQKPALESNQRLFLVCGGVDYSCCVRIDNHIVHQQEGMFTPFSIDLSSASDGTLVEIMVAPVPKAPNPPGITDPHEVVRFQARQSCKPAVSYGWDFHPRLIPLGIWEETYLEIRSADGWLNDLEVTYDLAADFSSATLRLQCDAPEGQVRWILRHPSGEEIATRVGAAGGISIHLDKPLLWWPRTEGEPALYGSKVEVIDSSGRTIQTIDHRVGIRRIRLTMGRGQFDRATGGMPVTQPPVPITFEVNGRRIFARGANWVCPEIFPGTLTADRYREQLTLFAGANLNLLRNWGGAIVNKTTFFEQCDELGIMVWQEFPLACNRYEGIPAYLRVLDQESRSIILRRRRHACIALWCGGNELFNSWSGMTMQDAALRLLDRNCFDLDPNRSFLPTSPMTGIRHGDYRFRMGKGPEARTVFDVYPSLDATAYVEFGVSAPASVGKLREFLASDELWPVSATPAWVAHHGFEAWYSGEPNSWLYPEVAEHYFGTSTTLEQLVKRLQLLQGEGYKAIYEEARRQKPACSAVACWVFNEPWPCAANNSLISWPNEPKPAYYAVAAANRPLMASARIPRFDWRPGAEIAVTLFLLNDSPQSIDPLKFEVLLEADGKSAPIGNWDCPGAQPNAHCAGPVVKGRIPDWQGETFDLVISVGNRPDLSSRYTLALMKV